MPRCLLLLTALFALAACAPTGGLLVSDKARPLGGNLFIEESNSGNTFMVLDGEISPETSFVFQAMVEQADVEGLVIAQSPGGDLLAAHQIGRTIKRKRMNTLVLVSCISACVDIFVAGRKREMLDFAELGLHSATNRDVSYELDQKYWREMGLPIVNEKAYAVPNSQLWIMDAKRARELRVATNILASEE